MLVFAFIVMFSLLGPNWGTESPSTSASPNVSCHIKCFSNGSCISEARPCDGGRGCRPSADQQNCHHHAAFARQLHIVDPGEVTSANPVVAPVNSSGPLMLKNLPFAGKLSNPCDWEKPPFYTPPESRDNFLLNLYHMVDAYARRNKEANLDMNQLMNQLFAFPNCANLGMHNLPYTPTLAVLERMNDTEALNKIYLSLLVHSAYSYFTQHQFLTRGLKCSPIGVGDSEEIFANMSYHMAELQRDLACQILVGMSVLESEKDDVLPLLNTTVSSLSVCSKRLTRDCRLVKSTHQILRTISSYTSKRIQEMLAERVAADQEAERVAADQEMQ